MKISKISTDSHDYLAPLVNIPKPPQMIYWRGELPTDRTPTVAIVGSRKPTAYGREVASKLSSELARKGIVIVSGLALGIDAIAHASAVEAGGQTIAVLPNSVDQIYPRTNRDLAEQIINSNGAVLSEYQPPTEFASWNLLARNRIVSGMSDAVIIIEAASRSGTLATATHALEQGKTIFAVPGNITSPLSVGCNKLIKQGAIPLTAVDDVLEVIAPQSLKTQSPLILGDTPLESKIIELLQTGLRDGDELQRLSGADAPDFNQALTMMEINGVISALGANKWALK